MSKIENIIKPIFLDLISGNNTRINPEQQRWIATWAVLKSIVAEYDDGGQIVTHHMQKKRMMNKHLPPERGCGVWIGHYKRSKWAPYWIGTPLLILSKESRFNTPGKPASYFNSYITTQVVGELFIQIIRSPMPNLIHDWRFPLPGGGKLLRIWPRSNYSVLWPPQTMTDSDADRIAAAFVNFVRPIATATN